MTFLEQITNYYESAQTYKIGLMQVLLALITTQCEGPKNKFLEEIIEIENFQQRLLAAKSIISKKATKAEIRTVEEFLKIKQTKISNS